MITVDVFYNEKGLIYKYKSMGHADTVEEGFDPVCAMISLTIQTPILGLEQHLKRGLSLKVNEEEGIIEVELQDKPDELTEAILATMVYTLADLSSQYPGVLHTKEHRR